MKYRIIVNGFSEGWSLSVEEFDTVDEAVKHATKNTYGSDFLIITVINWTAQIAPQSTEISN